MRPFLPFSAKVHKALKLVKKLPQILPKVLNFDTFQHIYIILQMKIRLQSYPHEQVFLWITMWITALLCGKFLEKPRFKTKSSNFAVVPNRQ